MDCIVLVVVFGGANIIGPDKRLSLKNRASSVPSPSSCTPPFVMHRRFSTLVKSSSSSGTSPVNEKTIEDDNESGVSTILRAEPLPVPSLKVKRVDNYYSRWSKSWKYRVSHCGGIVMYGAQLIYCPWYLRRTQAPSTQLRPSQSCKVIPMMRGKTSALCKETLISLLWLNSSYWDIATLLIIRIVRTLSRTDTIDPTYKIVIKSEYILKACKDVIQSWPGISWNSDPLEVNFTLKAPRVTLIKF
jgi:hypothetical protein